MEQNVGFIGLGIMGRPMAENLSKRFPVWGYDTQPERFEDLKGVVRAESAQAVAKACPVVCLSLPSAAVVEAVLLGSGGLVESLAPGSLVIDLSTGLPSLSRQVAARLESRGCQYVDAPVSGGQAGAQAGTLAIMVGASETAFQRALPYLSALGQSVVRAGDVGAGGVAKLVNNMIVGVTFSVVAEGFALAVQNGIDPHLLHEAIKGGWAASPVLEVSAPAIVARQYIPGGTINMLQKDLAYARLLATESKVPLPMTAAAHELFVAGQAAGRGAQSQPALFELWAKEATS